MSDVSTKPFWCDYRIGSYMIKSKRWMPFWEWRCLVSYQVAQSGTRGHSDMTIGLVPTRSDVSAHSFEHACWIGSSLVSDVSAEHFQKCMLDWFLACVRCKCIALLAWRIIPCIVEYKCWAFLTLVVRCKCRAFRHGGLVPCMTECKCWAFPTLVDGYECWAFLIGLWVMLPHA